MWVYYGRAYFLTSMSLQKRCKGTKKLPTGALNY